MIDKEEFDAWRHSPVTEAVFKALALKAAEAKQAWVVASWGQGNTSEVLLADLRATSETCTYVTELDHDELEAMLESDRNSPDRVQSADPPKSG